MYYNSLFLLIQKLSYVLALGVGDGIQIIVRGLHLKKKKKKKKMNKIENQPILFDYLHYVKNWDRYPLSLRPLFYSNKDTSSYPSSVDCVRNIFLSFDATRCR